MAIARVSERILHKLCLENKVVCSLCYDECSIVTGFLNFDGLTTHSSVSHKRKLDATLKSDYVSLTNKQSTVKTMA